jgi:cobalt-zinc-cadmium resistance protein CzcA
MKKAIDFLLDNRWLVFALLGVLVISGLVVMAQLPIEAFPDLTNNQVVVTVQCPGMSPVEVEQLVTFPIETTMMGMPKMQAVRSDSKLGLSMVTIIFDDSMDRYLIRQLVSERLNEARNQLPAGLEPQMGPMATAFGEVYQYTISAPRMTLMQIKTLQDWVVRYALLNIPGVSEVNSWGGETKEYVIEVDPESLRRYDLTLHQVMTAVSENNANFGGGYIEHAEQQFMIRGIGRVQNVADIGNIVVSTVQGVPVLLNQIATIEERSIARNGAVMKDARGESVSGMVITMQGANGLKVIRAVKEKIASLKLPGGAKIVPFYDQSDVINATTATVKKNLLEAAVLVVVILFLFLGDWRAALVVALTIPLSLLFGFIGMGLFGISVNLMSLGAIDFGTIVDGSVVMVENCIHRLEAGRSSRPLLEVIRDAASEVARPIVFGVLIIIAVYLPILTLQSLEGRMFRPMAVTVVSALVGSLLLALFVVPSLCWLALRNRAMQVRSRVASRRGSDESWNTRLLQNLRTGYDRTLTVAFRHRKVVLASAATLVVAAVVSLKFIGTEFMPTLDEGSMIVTSKRLPGISLTESVTIGKKIEAIIKSFPEVQSVVTKLGRPDLATEAMGVEESDSYISFTPEMQNASPERKEEFSTRLRHQLETIPGVAYEFSQPMQMRMEETITGTRGAVALKIFGTDLNTLEQLAEQAEKTIAGVPGAVGTQMEHLSGAEELQIQIDRAEAARYGVNVAQVQEMIEALYGGKQVSEMITGNERFPIALRLPDNLRNNPDDLRALQIKTASGELIRLDQIAAVRSVPGPNMISREEAHRRTVVLSNVSGRDLGTFVKGAKTAIDRNLHLPQGYWLEWGGQYENEVRAEQRLAIVLPVSIFIIAGLLYASFQNVRQVLLILLIVPLALVGGIAALWIRGINLNLSASIGFIALFGIAVLNGIVMVSHINSLRDQGKDMEEAVREGASDRLRPVLITALVASLGFIPMALATSRGAEVERPLATVVIGGLATATLLTLYVLPLLYPLFSKTRQPAFTEVPQSV